MAAIKLAYIGGGSSRAPGTVASFIGRGESFRGSEVVLIDLDAERLEIVATIARKLIRAGGLDLTVTATTDRREGVRDCDAVLTSFRPGGFEARHLDESIPLAHGVIGQETQGPGGFFMALRAVQVMREIVADLEAVAPKARIFNYTNPINIVSQAITRFSDVPIVSLCEGPIYFAADLARAADLDPEQLDAVMVGLNHASWSVRHLYRGEDVMPLVRAAYERKRDDPSVPILQRRMLRLASIMGSIPADYFQYYYYRDALLAELRARETTRAQDILSWLPGYWRHYREQAAAEVPVLDPERSRGGIFELELAVDVIDALFNDRREVWPVNVPNRGALADFPDDLVVEVPGFVASHGITPLAQGRMPGHLLGLVKMLGEYQALAAEVAWQGDRLGGIRALASHPLVPSLELAETLYDEMAVAHRAFLPARLLR